MNNRVEDEAISEEVDEKMEESANSNDLHENAMMGNLNASLNQQNFITHIIKQPTNEQLSILNTLNINPTKPQQDSEISEKQLREKLILMFKKDKQKNYEICDYFMKDLGLAEHFENAKRFIEFIERNELDNVGKGNGYFGGNESADSQLEKQFTEPKPSNLTSPNLSIFSTKSTFIASTFSRDKVHILLELHSTNNKIINFLNFLLVSLRSYIFTNQKEWILMKDEIERYLSKYEKNVEKIYEVDDELQEEEEVENCDLNEGKRLSLTITKAQAKLEKTKQIKKISSELRKKYTKRFTLENYKSETSKVRQKLTEHQESMCSALRKSCYAIYERFEHIVEELKDEMLFVIALLEKAERFNESKEKCLIKQFLLESRRVGVEGLIYLELVYKNIIEKVETTRRKILYEIEQTVNNKKSLTLIFGENRLEQQHNNNNKDYYSKSKKELAFVREVSIIFHKLERTLMVKRNVNNVNNNEVESSNKIRRSSLLFNQREVVVEVDGDDESVNASSSISKSHSSGEKIKSFEVLGEKDIEKKGEEKFNHEIKSLILKEHEQPIKDLPSPPQEVIEESESEKFISAIFGDRKCSQEIKKVEYERQREKERGKEKEERKKKDAILDAKKKKRIRKVNKIAKDEDWKQVEKKSVEKKVFESDKKQVKKETRIKKTGLRNFPSNHHHNPQTLSPIDSEDESNKSSSSLEYLSHTLITTEHKFTSPKKSTPKLEEQIKNPSNYSSMKKSNHNNHYEEFESLSIDIPFCIQYESGEINMEDFDEVSEQMSSFYNDVIEDGKMDCGGGKRE